MIGSRFTLIFSNINKWPYILLLPSIDFMQKNDFHLIVLEILSGLGLYLAQPKVC